MTSIERIPINILIDYIILVHNNNKIIVFKYLIIVY